MLWKTARLRFSDRLGAARQGDLEAFNSFVVEHQETIYNLAYWLLGSEQAAGERVQEIFLEAFRALPSLRLGPQAQESALRAWLIRRTVQSCREALRQRPFRPAPAAPDSSSYPSRLLSLPFDLRLVITLVDLQGLEYTEAANLLEIPVQVFGNRLAQARCHLLGEVW